MTTLKLVPVQPQNRHLRECQVIAPYRTGQLELVGRSSVPRGGETPPGGPVQDATACAPAPKPEDNDSAPYACLTIRLSRPSPAHPASAAPESGPEHPPVPPRF